MTIKATIEIEYDVKAGYFHFRSPGHSLSVPDTGFEPATAVDLMAIIRRTQRKASQS